jgi:tRNA nucleotidyltransferase (CCA-adding enzyme)
VSLPTRSQLAERIRALPAAAPLLDCGLDALPGLHLVGGAVRDLLLGGSPTDLDLVYEGDPNELRARLGGRVVVHDRFGTATIRADGFVYDIARSRRERYAAPGALPDVEPASLEEDLRRRDFTVNAMAISLWPQELGALHSAPGATADLEQRLLRVLHDRSFVDDPTRLFRMVRYQARLGFEIEARTRSLADAALFGQAMQTVSGPRMGTELRLLAAERDPIRVFTSMRQLGLDTAIHPQFGLRDPSLLERALALLPAGARRDLAALTAAALEVPAGQLAGLLDRLSFHASDRDRILAAAGRAEELTGALAAAHRPSEIALVVGGAQPELVALAGALGPEEQARQWLERLSEVKLEIGGSDLLAAGVAEGPAIGEGLQAALLAKLDGAARDRVTQLRVALQAARASAERWGR